MAGSGIPVWQANLFQPYDLWQRVQTFGGDGEDQGEVYELAAQQVMGYITTLPIGDQPGEVARMRGGGFRGRMTFHTHSSVSVGRDWIIVDVNPGDAYGQAYQAQGISSVMTGTGKVFLQERQQRIQPVDHLPPEIAAVYVA